MTMKNPQKTKIGLREIAAVAGVSVASVSRVLNGNSRVALDIQKNVMDASAKLNVDLSLRNKATAIAFLLSNRVMLHTFHSRILVGAETYCSAQGWDWVLLSFNYSPNTPWNALHLPRAVQRRDTIRAVILAGTNSRNLLDMLDHKGIPSVVLGNNISGEPQVLGKTDVVFSDDVQGGYDITQYLIGLGHRRIGFVGNLRMPWFIRSFNGYCRSMEQAGLAACPSSIDSENDNEVGYLGTKSLLARSEAITAIFAGNDPTADGVYKALRDSGLRIPEDVSVVGCDDTVGAWLYPRLTTIREFPELLGKRMAQMVLQRITKPRLDPQCATIPTELVKRESCRPIDASKISSADEAALTTRDNS